MNHLPKWATNFLRAICPENLFEEIEGDIIQEFSRKQKSSGIFRAKWFLLITLIRYCRPGIILRNKFRKPRLNVSIFKNYWLISWRHALKDKLNASFKLIGLSLAMFTLLIVGLYLSYNLSFDRYHLHHERIFRVNTQRTENGNIEHYGIAPVAFGAMLQNEFPEVETFARLDIANGSHLRYHDKVVFGGVFGVDSTWFDLFSHEFISGSADALMKPNGIVLTESLAKKIFGDEEPMQKLLRLNNNEGLYEVTAVIKDIPYNSHLRGEAFTLFNRSQDLNAQHIISPPEFVDNSAVLFVKLRENNKKENFLGHLERSLDKFIPHRERKKLGFAVSLQPVADIYLDAPLKYEFTRKGSILYLYIFGLLGLFVAAIACINYANLSLAGFISRAREIGIRKVLGGRRSQIVVQITLDTAVYSVAALVISITALYLLFPQIQQQIEPHLQFTSLMELHFACGIAAMLLLLIVVSTAIPASWFARNAVINDLRGVVVQGGKMKFNNSLLLLQFAISIVCIGSTLTIGRQIDFIHNQDLGIDRKNLLVLTMAEDFTVAKMRAFKTTLKGITGVSHVSNSSFRMGGGFWKDWYEVQIGDQMKSFELYEVFSDDELFETLGMKVLEGRTFDADHRADSGAAFVVNETAVRELGLANAVGTRILTHPEEPGKWEGTIVGVVNDININTLHQKVQPLVMRLPWQNEYPEYFVYVRFVGDAQPVIHAIKQAYNNFQPGYPLEVHFVDDFYNNEYEQENKAYASLKFGTIIILIISALGIFSLSLYLSTRKMKEFGIRKVLGASAERITTLHVWHFVRIAMMAMVISIPISIYLMNVWLSSFAYRVTQNAATAISVIAATLMLIAFSAGYAALRAGNVNPAKVINRE